MTDKVTSLYNALKADGLFKQARSLNDFKAKMAYQGYRSQIYKLARDKGANVGTFSQFTNALGYSSGSPKPRQSYGSYHTQQSQKPATTAQRAMQVPRQYQRTKPLQTRQPRRNNVATPSGTDYMKNWELMTKRNDQMTPLEQARANKMRSRMQNAQKQAGIQQQRHATPISKSKITPDAKSFDETMQQLSTPEAKRERAVQQRKDDARNLAEYEVGGNYFTHDDGKTRGTVGNDLLALVDSSINEAKELTRKQYQENLDKMGGIYAPQYVKDKAFRDAQTQEQVNRQNILMSNLNKKINDIYSQRGMQQHILESAEKLNMGVEEYVDKYVTPEIMNYAQKALTMRNQEEIMPHGALDYIAKNLSNSIIGMVLAPSVMSRDTRQRLQEGIAIADGDAEIQKIAGHEDKTYRSGIGTRFVSTAANMAVDAGPLAVIGAGASAAVNAGTKALTNGLVKAGVMKAAQKLTAQQMAFKVANMTTAQKIMSGLGTRTATSALNLAGYSGVTAALNQASTGDDTSLSSIAKAGREGAGHGAITGSMFGLTGAAMAPWVSKFGITGMEKTTAERLLHGVQKVGATATGLGVEAGTMMVADNITGDKDISFGQWLEDVVMVGAFKAGEPSNFVKIGNILHHITHNDNSHIAIGRNENGSPVYVDVRLTPDEKNELISSASGKNLMDAFTKVDRASKTAPRDQKYKTAYTDFMNDPEVSQATKEKVNAALGLFNIDRGRSYRSVNDVQNKQILEYTKNGTLLTRTSYKNADERRAILYKQKAYRDNDEILSLVGMARLKDRQYLDDNGIVKNSAILFLMDKGYDPAKEPSDPSNASLIAQLKNEKSALYAEWVKYADRTGIVGEVNSNNSFLDDSFMGGVKDVFGIEDEERSLFSILAKDPMKRTDRENEVIKLMKSELESKLFPNGEPHEEQAVRQGEAVAQDNNLGTMQPEGGAVKAELDGLKQAENEMDVLIRDNDVFGQNFQKLKQQGLTNPQIYDWMVQQGGLTVEKLEPFAHYINANARVQGMQEATKNAIDEQVSSYVQDWSFHGTLNGQEKNGEQAIYVQDSNGRTLLVGTGEVAFDTTTGRAKEGVGDMLVCLDPKSGETVYVKSDEVKFVGTQSTDDFANGYRQELQMKNSEPYNQAAQEQAMQDAAKPQTVEKSKDDATKGGDLTKDDTTLTKVDTTSGKDNTTSEDLVPQEQPQPTRKFADGSDVPMTKDSKGRPTPNYEKMTPEQSAEILAEDFGENAEKVVDGQIQKAEKALKDAEKIKVDYTAEPNDIMEQEALKKKTVEAAKSQLAHAKNIKKTMTAKKVAETVGNTEQAEGAHEAGSVAAQKFANAPRLVGNKRTRMLADGETKIKGHYEIVPAESLTPSHDVDNGYKKSEGFPTDAEGRTVNDRDYEHDKAAQQNTDQIARKYNGMAIEQVPVVSDEGIVYDGNGRTMAGQKAAKEGTDGEYINDLLENAENFGFTREQIEQSGIEHPRLVLVTDERLPYDTATFSKFNRNEKKTQSNTEQAVAKAKTLTSDEVGAIVAEIEGSGSLDAFFNNSKAINDLVKTLVDKGIIGQNEVAQMMDNPERLSAQGREYVKNLLLGSIFKPETIRMLGIDSAVKNKAVNAIRSVMDNMKLGDYSLRDEIDQAIQLLYEARQGGNKVDTLLRTPDMFGEDAAKRYPSISQMMALALEGKVADFRDLLDEYNRIAASRNTGEGNMFEAAPTKEELINEYLNLKKWQDYGTGHSENEGGNDVSGIQEPKQETSGGNEPAEAGTEPEPAVKVNNAIKKIATEITKQTGIEVVTDEKEAQRALEDADSNVKYSREAGGAVLDWGNVPSKARISNDELTTIIMRNNREYIDELDKLGEGEFIEHYVDANGYFYTFRVDKNHHIYMDEAISKTSSANRERINELKEYYDGERARYSEEVRSNRSESQSELGRSEDSYRSTIGTGNSENSAMGGRIGESDSKGNVERDTSRPEQSGSALKEFRSANGEVYGFTVGGKIYLDTKKMKPETPLHEYTHLWTEALRNTNPEEWENVKGLFDKVDGLKDEIQKLYPELKGDALYEEMISTFSGREGAKKLEETVRNLAQQEGKSVEESAKATGFLGKVKEALQRYWKGVADMLHIHFTSADDVADKVLADWAKGANPKDYKAKEEPVETKREEAKTEKSKDWTDEEIDKLSSVESKWQEKVDDYISENYPAHNGVRSRTTEEQAKYDAETEAMKEDATLAKMRKDADAEYKATEEEIRNSHLPKDPMEGIKQAAGAFHEEQKQKGEFVMNLKLGKARQEYAEAKERGDASEIKRTRDELKQLLDEHYKAQHMGLVQRRKEIAKEIGMTEAKKIDKPWSEMDGEERMATAEKSPLTEKEIRSNASDENQDLIEDAIDYINGNHGFAQQLAYLKIYEDVRNRHENATDNSGAENGAQLAPADNGSGEGLGLGTGRESGGTDGQLDRGTGNESAPGEPERREGGQNDSTLSVGKSGDKQGEGNSSDMGAVPAGNTNTKGSSSTGKDGNVSEQGGRGGSNRPAKPDAKRKPAAKQGTTWRGRTEAEIKQEHKDAKAGLKAALAEMLKRGRGEVSLSLVGLNSKQIEYVPELMKAVKRYGMSLIDQGIYKIKDWANNIREGIYDEMKEIGFSDQDIDDFIKEMWNSKMPMDGETHTIAEWCSIYGNAQLRKKLGEELDVKYQKQMDAEPIEVKIGDRKNIEETLPFLLPQQQEDVLKAETQFFGKDHTDREHAYGKGYMFTNGTGTGKTYTGLGIAKRLAKQGKGRILFITPSQKKVNDWMKDGKNLGLDIRDLDSVAKEKGTTATTESGDGMVITTFANFGLNKKILETEWDAVIYDECHRIMENKKGAETARSMQHYMMTNRDENHCFLRLQTINPHYQKMQNAADRFNELRQKEVQRIQKEYKQSHPSATAKDVVNATFSQLPKELNSFALADATAFPKLGKAYQDFTSAKQHYYNNVEPKLKEQAKNTWKNTKTIFLSATPFNTRENLDYAEGYIFKFPDDDGSRMSGRSRFYLDHFGAAYRYRYNRLEAKTDNPAAVAKQEVAFSDYLQDTLGTMSGRIIDSAYDYSRDFPTVAPDHADEFNNAVEEAVKGRYLGEAYSRTIGDYNYGSALFETMKVANIIQRMKYHLAAGRKIVVFHRRVETKNPIQPPFAYMLEYANHMIAEMKPGKERNEAIKECTEFRNKYADLLDWEQTLDYSMPREQIAKVFGRDNVLFFSGKESKKVKDKAVDTFNDDNSGKNIIVIQEASGKEGISLHDVTGNHQRVLITLGLPQSPITALQIEGRTYRIGNKSNAIFEYPILGLNSEMMLFGQKFNNQVSTTENLALGSQARNLRDSFANGILEHSGIIPIDQQGVGGKEFDAPKQSDSDPFDDAVLDYYSNQKLNKNNREGVDYFPTPEPLGYKMVEWANMGEGDTALEPSAGHGAIARYVSKSNELLSIEPSQSLFAKLQLKAGGLGRKFLNNTFENYNVANKHDVVVMNPPFGTAGTTAIAHLDKAFRHLDEGGRVVAIIPRGSTDKKFDKWYGEQKNAAMRAEVDLPDIVFQQAGTNVRCRVVVLDKITDDTLRSKAGYPEKIDLSGHYDKIEDFFEDLRDVQMPDRIIDTQMKSMKKARTFKKDIEDIKGMTVTIEKNGISVFDKNAYRDYSISFPSIKHNEEWTKENYSKVYERFDQEQNRVYSENSKAALDEMKKLACKLAGMSEEEMQKYISDKKNGGTHFREDRGLQYSKTDAKDVKNSRIIPEDVDKDVSSQIEKKFDSTIKDIEEHTEDRDKSLFADNLDSALDEFSNLGRSEIEYIKNDYERKIEKLSGRSTDGRLGGKNDGNGNKGSYLLQYYKTILAVADRELAYRDVRAKNLRETWGLQPGGTFTLGAVERIFKETNRDKAKAELFQKALDISKRLGVNIIVSAEDPNRASGRTDTYRNIDLYIDGLTKTSLTSNAAPTVMLHEMIHVTTMGAINLVKKGKAEGMLTPKQIEGVKTILEIYDRVKDDKERFKEEPYGLTDDYELTAQMADSRQRKAMDLSILDRVVNAAHEFARKGDRSILQRVKDAMKKLFEISDKDKMDKALNDIMDDFNETIDDISMNEIEQDGFAYKVTDKDELDRLNKEKTFRMYSGMQEVDGKLYSPMAAIIDGKRTDATEIGAWMGADERPDLVKNGKFTLVKTDKNKGVGEGDVPAAYNPYMHTSTSMMNDQFTGAYARGNIKVVEWEIPESEKTSGYHAEGAKDAVGLVPWHSGSVNSLLPKDRQRQVMLSRWRKAVRVVPDSEVAESIAEQLKGTGLAIPWNVVTPNQVRELAKLGVPITTVESGRQAPETKEKFLQQMADLEQEFPQAKFVNVKMTKDAFKVWGKDSGTKFRTDHGDVNYPASSVEGHVEKVAQKTGGKVKMVSSVDEITNKAAKAAIEEGRKITGWYDENTGEVHLYMPNIHDRYTAEKTIWHEVVGHKGMRELFGEERFEKFLRDVWYDLDKPENAALKKLVDEERKFNPMNIYDAIEEGIARLAEDGKGEAGFWNGIKNKVSDFLHEIGYRIAPNTKDVKYLLWLSKNLQKNPNDPYWKLRAEAVKYRLDHEDIRSVVSHDGVFYENDGKARSLADLPKADYQEATDGQIHFRTTPTAATALDRYHRSLDEHGYMATESYMDNMLSLKKLMNAIVPDKKIEDIASSENPYILQNVMQGAMSDAAKMFEINIMSPLEKAMAGVLDAFEGKKTDDKIRNFNLYMITKHGLERNRVLFVRDAVRKLRMDDSTKADAEKLQSEWGAKKEDLGNQLKSGIIDLKRYYEKMDEWIRDNVNKDYEAGEHDYSGMHGVQDIISMKDPYNDGEAIQSVMDSEAKMESVKAGSVRDYWGKVRAATRYSVDSDYNNGIIDRDLHGHVSKMFDWYVPLRNYDETTAEDVYGYITEIGDPKNRIGSTLAKARGHKYLSETNILAQIGALGNRAIKNGGDNAIKQAFARFARNHSDNNLIKETSVWYVKDPTTGIVEERYPDIPEGATADEINQIVSDFDTDMAMLKAQGLATKKFDRGNIGYRFERAKDKSQHIVDVMIAGKKHSFVILGNPRAAQALNGMLEHKNESLAGRTTAAISRFMAQTCTSYNPEFVMRNMIRDFEFASTNLLAKEGMAYTKTFEKYYAQVGLIEGIRNTKLSDFKKMTGFGLFSKYRNGTLDTSDKIQRYFKEFMENGGETGWVQIKNMKDLTAEYKLHVKTEKNGKARVSKNVFDFIFKNLENANEVAENLTRFATYCASRDAGRSTVRSAYDAKEVSVNFNRHGSGNAIYSFKNGEMSNAKTARKNVYGFWASWFRNSSMFFNAGVQSTNLLIKNFKNNKAGTIGYIMAGPMMSGMAMALINNMLIASEDEKDRKGVKDPYGELPDYIRRNNLCIYVGGGEFITIPLAIEERAFYGLGDLAAGLTFSKNISGQKNPALDAVGCMSQLVPVADYLGNASFGKNPGEETIKAIAPSAVSPIIEWFFNSDWKGAPIHRENKFDENQPSWMLAYKGTPEWLININKKANAWSNDVAPGNENMKGNDFLDAATDPSLLQHLYSSYLGGAATFMERVGGLVKKGNDTETKDIPFVRSLFYTPSEQTSLQRTKSKWYNYLDETEKMIANAKRLKSKKVPLDELVKNYGDYYKFKQSKGAEKMNVIETATKEMKRWKDLRNKSNDAESINFANQNIDYIMMRAVNELDKLN